MGGRGLPAPVRPPGARVGLERRPRDPRRAWADRDLMQGGARHREVRSDRRDRDRPRRAREGIDNLPVAHLDEQALEIRILADYRDQIIAERVRLANRWDDRREAWWHQTWIQLLELLGLSGVTGEGGSLPKNRRSGQNAGPRPIR
jgi:hypothetical protein